MSFQQFLEKWNGRFIDFDGAYGNQCFDLFHQYCVEVLGLTDGRILAAPGAKDIFNNFSTLFGHEYFNKIANTPEGVPLEGDIMVWGSGTWGHVAIFVEGNVNSFRSFDQNYPTDSPCHIQNHTSYAGILGWLQCKTEVDTGNLQQELEKCAIARNSHWTWLLAIRDACGVTGEYNQTTVLSRIDGLIQAEIENGKKDAQLTEARQQAVDLEKKMADKTKEAENAQMIASEMTEKATDLELQYNKLVGDYKGLQTEVGELKQSLLKPIPTGWKKWIILLLGL